MELIQVQSSVVPRVPAQNTKSGWEPDQLVRAIQIAILLARGYDEADRKQSRYHPKWSEVTANYKFTRIIEFGKLLPVLRKAIEKDIGASGLTKSR